MVDKFRSFIIGTLHLVAFIAFFGSIIFGVLGGMDPGYLDRLNLPFDLPATTSPILGAVIGGVVGWLTASIALGVLFILLDIQDGIRDLLKLAAKENEAL